MVVTICKKCEKTSDALFSRICDKCFNKETNGKKIRIDADSLHCLRCDHYWEKRKVANPVCCPACKTAYWNVPRKNPVCSVCGKESFLIAKRCRECNAKYMAQRPKNNTVQKKQRPMQRLHGWPDKKLMDTYPTRAQYFKEKYG